MLITLLMTAACYPKGPEFTDDYDLVATSYDPAFDFSSLTTYALPDSVVKITGNLLEDDEIRFVSPVYNAAIISSLRENLNKLGWTEVRKFQNPDVIILPSACENTTVYYYDYYYWDWWYPYSYWNWYYPYSVYAGSYSTGSLLIQMTQPEGRTAADNIPVIWVSVVNGLLEGSTTSIGERINRSIDQAFAQSPYLKE